jgi:hypothetical protein
VTAAATTELDWSISNVTGALKEAGVWNTTLVIFVTDKYAVQPPPATPSAQ